MTPPALWPGPLHIPPYHLGAYSSFSTFLSSSLLGILPPPPILPSHELLKPILSPRHHHPAINKIPNVYASSIPSVWEALYTIGRRVMSAAANPKSLTTSLPYLPNIETAPSKGLKAQNAI
jgi:hypothetical protein